MDKKPKLTEPQRRLLQEMRDSSTGGLYVRRFGRYHKTARALVAKGYAVADRDWYTPTPEGGA